MRGQNQKDSLASAWVCQCAVPMSWIIGSQITYLTLGPVLFGFETQPPLLLTGKIISRAPLNDCDLEIVFYPNVQVLDWMPTFFFSSNIGQ